jgi:hypothetical protein
MLPKKPDKLKCVYDPAQGQFYLCRDFRKQPDGRIEMKGARVWNITETIAPIIDSQNALIQKLKVKEELGRLLFIECSKRLLNVLKEKNPDLSLEVLVESIKDSVRVELSNTDRDQE